MLLLVLRSLFINRFIVLNFMRGFIRNLLGFLGREIFMFLLYEINIFNFFRFLLLLNLYCRLNILLVQIILFDWLFLENSLLFHNLLLLNNLFCHNLLVLNDLLSYSFFRLDYFLCNYFLLCFLLYYLLNFIL